MVTHVMRTKGAAWEPAWEGWERWAVMGSQAGGEGEDSSGSLPKNGPFSALVLGCGCVELGVGAGSAPGEHP